MQEARKKVSRSFAWLSAGVAALVALAFPVVYFAAAYGGLAGTLSARAQGYAIAVNRLVSLAPDLWQYQHERLEVQLHDLVAASPVQQARLIDTAGGMIVEVGGPPAAPAVVRSAPLHDAGRAVGAVEVSESLRGVLEGTLLAAGAGLLLAAGVYFTARALPLRVLDRALAEVEAGRRMLSEAQRIAGMGSWEYDGVLRRLTWSEQLHRMLGTPVDAGPRLRVLWSRLHTEDRRAVRATLRAWFGGDVRDDVEFRVRPPAGAERIMHGRCEIVRAAGGGMARLSGTVLDVTEEKRAREEIRRLNEELEERVRLRTRELRETVEQLEAFSYSVAHDLRAPIRSINSFAHLLLHAAPGAMNAAAVRYVDRIIGASTRMASLIDGLIELGRVSRTELRFVPVDLTGMAQEIMARIAKADPGRAVRFDVEPGLTVTADAQLLRQALAHLLDNAWKFTAHAGDAHVEMRRAEDGGRSMLMIRDNGAGFDMRYAHKLFGAFQRLHGAEEYPGTGIGLVTAQRIIARHGGSLHMTSEPGKGTSVYFTV